MSGRPIYLDYNATTPVDPRVLEKMLPFFTGRFGNAASIDHRHGSEAKDAVEEARDQVAQAVGARSEEIIFTSGATESNNLALIGAALANRDRGKHIISVATEHHAVLDTLEYLKRIGFEITILPVDPSGHIRTELLREAIRPDTIIFSAMAANNEIGTLAPLEEVGRLTRERGVLFHTDAAQGLAYMDLKVDRAQIDLMSLSAHKCYGPKGVGALYVRRRSPRVKLEPLFHGGGHERGLRSGTLNVPGIVGFGEAARIARALQKDEARYLQRLRAQVLGQLKDACPSLEVNGTMQERLPGNLNVMLPGVENRALIHLLSANVSISAGSACTSTRVEPSHVLLALGRTEQEAHNSIRIGLGRFTTEQEVEEAGALISDAIRRVQAFSRGTIVNSSPGTNA